MNEWLTMKTARDAADEFVSAKDDEAGLRLMREVLPPLVLARDATALRSRVAKLERERVQICDALGLLARDPNGEIVNTPDLEDIIEAAHRKAPRPVAPEGEAELTDAECAMLNAARRAAIVEPIPSGWVDIRAMIAKYRELRPVARMRMPTPIEVRGLLHDLNDASLRHDGAWLMVEVASAFLRKHGADLVEPANPSRLTRQVTSTPLRIQPQSEPAKVEPQRHACREFTSRENVERSVMHALSILPVYRDAGRCRAGLEEALRIVRAHFDAAAHPAEPQRESAPAREPEPDYWTRLRNECAMRVFALGENTVESSLAHSERFVAEAKRRATEGKP